MSPASSTDGVAERLASVVGATAVASAPLGSGGPVLPLASPADEGELAELLRLAASEQWKVIPCGMGSKLGWTGQPERADLLVSTRRISGVLLHEPADGTLSARAGTPMHELRSRAAAGGHWLTPDVAAPQRATLGGALAAGQSGLDRLRFGPLRHHVLGARVMLADGTLAKSGGQLVKNVTGFDLHRLYTGSHGTLCVVLEAALRLFPLPESDVLAMERAGDASAALTLARAALSLPARFVSVWLARLDPPMRGAPWALFARLGGKREAVEAERAALAKVWTTAAWLEGDAARTELEELRDRTFEAGGAPWVRGTCRRSRVEAALTSLERRLESASLRARILVQPEAAFVDAAFATDSNATSVASAVEQWRTDMAALGGRAELRDATPELLARIDPWGPPPPGLEWMCRLKRALDPQGVFASGRLAGGL
jgi:glycolate dehydrogenase FAD-binding subunit